jgi:hypothetical protein
MLENLKPPSRTFPCRVAGILETLDDKDKKILTDAVMNPEWQLLTLENSLRDLGIQLSASTIKRHRTRVCSCWKN